MLGAILVFLQVPTPHIVQAASWTVTATSTQIVTGFNTGPQTFNISLNANNGDLVVLTAGIWQDVGPIGAITSITWTGGTMTRAASSTSVNISCEQWYLLSTTTGVKTLTLTVTGATDAIKMGASSFGGGASSNILDVSSTNTGATAVNPTVTLSPTVAGDLIVTNMHRFSTTASTPGGTAIWTSTTTASTYAAADRQTDASTGSFTNTWTGTNLNDWSVCGGAYKAASAGGGGGGMSSLLLLFGDWY